ncbi:MAG: bifunctional oligoribonuclease/PAP phosphatase NrnA [Acidaminococcaceae bacterium]
MSRKLNLAQTATLLQVANNIVIVSHVSPDGDTLGSALALAAGLKNKGKKVTLVVDDQISSMYDFLPGISEYQQYQEGVTYQADLMVIIDASSLDRAGRIPQAVQAPILNIDHHISNTEYADDLYLDANAAATGEIIYQLLRHMQLTIDKTIAVCLYVAIVTDCGYFKYSNTTPSCMICAAELVSLGVEPNVISDALEMKPKDNVILLSKILKTLAFEAEGRIAMIEISLTDYNKDIDTDSFIQYPRYIEGVEIAIMFKAVAANVTRVSMRSRWIDVSKIAVAFDGGGHKKAAGCTINADLVAAKTTLLEHIKDEMASS